MGKKHKKICKELVKIRKELQTIKSSLKPKELKLIEEKSGTSNWRNKGIKGLTVELKN